MNKMFLLIPLFAFMISGCEKSNFSAPSVNQLVLFQIEYVNYAWGYSHNGIIIDSAGNVGRFSYPENWHSPDSSGFISESDMNENYKQLGKPLFTIGKDTLSKYVNLMNGAAAGELSKPYNEMYDAGVAIYSCYFYYPLEKKYKMILIKQWGDWAIDNKSGEAEELYQWLVSIRSRVYNITVN